MAAHTLANFRAQIVFPRWILIIFLSLSGDLNIFAEILENRVASLIQEHQDGKIDEAATRDEIDVILSQASNSEIRNNYLMGGLRQLSKNLSKDPALTVFCVDKIKLSTIAAKDGAQALIYKGNALEFQSRQQQGQESKTTLETALNAYTEALNIASKAITQPTIVEPPAVGKYDIVDSTLFEEHQSQLAKREAIVTNNRLLRLKMITDERIKALEMQLQGKISH